MKRGPTLAGFLFFIRNEMQIPDAALPDGSPYIEFCYEVAIDTVNRWLNCVSPLIYAVTVYNLAADRLINFAPDQTGGTFFADLRSKWKLNSFVAGVIQSTADESTSESMLVPDFMKNLMLSDLQELKTPYGRVYLSYAQKAGPLWGIS